VPARLDALALSAVLACVASVSWPLLATADADPPPPIRVSHIPFGPERLADTAAYSHRHYGDHTWQLTPRAIVLHYTCGPSYRSAWYTFARNAPHHGEAPGVSAHYIVDRDGTVHELVPPTVRARHTTGLNHVAIGVEFVQRCLRAGAGAAEAQLLGRTPQIEAGLRLVRYLRQQYAIPTTQILGHAMANRSPLFRDLLGLTNDHGDWRRGAVEQFMTRLDPGDELAAEAESSRAR